MPVMPTRTSSSFARRSRVLQRVLDERVLDDLVLDAGLAELGAELRDVLDGHPLEVEEDGRGHLVEPGLDLADLNSLVARSMASHLLVLPS
jgi:hypothetical protein